MDTSYQSSRILQLLFLTPYQFLSSSSMLLVKDAFKKMAFTVVDFGPNLELWNRNPAERTGLLVVEFMKVCV